MPEVDDAIRAQLERLDHTTYLGLTHEPGIVLAEKLLATAPAGLTRVFYAGDGASAVEAAIKMAFQAQAQRGRTRPYYVHVAEGYHGDTLGAVSVGGIDLFHATYRPILLETRMVSSPGVLAAGPDEGGAGRGGARRAAGPAGARGRPGVRASWSSRWCRRPAGCSPTTRRFLQGCRALADEFGALLVADEVATGIGRTGRMWAVEHAGITPDLLTCGKGLTGGYLPLSAVLATRGGLRGLPRRAGVRRAPSSTATPTPPTRCAAPRRSPTSTSWPRAGTVERAAARR